MTYSDESAGIVHSLLLLNLLQEGSLDVLVGLGRAGAKERHGGWQVLEMVLAGELIDGERSWSEESTEI